MMTVRLYCALKILIKKELYLVLVLNYNNH